MEDEKDEKKEIGGSDGNEQSKAVEKPKVQICHGGGEVATLVEELRRYELRGMARVDDPEELDKTQSEGLDAELGNEDWEEFRAAVGDEVDEDTWKAHLDLLSWFQATQSELTASTQSTEEEQESEGDADEEDDDEEEAA